MGEFKDLLGGEEEKCSGDDHGVMGSEGPGKVGWTWKRRRVRGA